MQNWMFRRTAWRPARHQKDNITEVIFEGVNPADKKDMNEGLDVLSVGVAARPATTRIE